VRIGIIMNGVTGRMGLNQHLVRSIVAIRQQGGVTLPSGGTVVPDPILVGRSEAKLREIARAHGIARVSTDLDSCLANPADAIYFDATLTNVRAANVRRALERRGIDYPVAIDNDYTVWSAFANHYWPALYFADAQGASGIITSAKASISSPKWLSSNCWPRPEPATSAGNWSRSMPAV